MIENPAKELENSLEYIEVSRINEDGSVTVYKVY
jgi:hypothetical protein